MRLQARAATDRGRDWFTWGTPMIPTAADPRQITFRVHVKTGEPTAIEIVVRMRKFDHSADEVRSVIFPWPAR
jgi:hypothetical protein